MRVGPLFSSPLDQGQGSLVDLCGSGRNSLGRALQLLGQETTMILHAGYFVHSMTTVNKNGVTVHRAKSGCRISRQEELKLMLSYMTLPPDTKTPARRVSDSTRQHYSTPSEPGKGSAKKRGDSDPYFHLQTFRSTQRSPSFLRVQRPSCPKARSKTASGGLRAPSPAGSRSMPAPP